MFAATLSLFLFLLQKSTVIDRCSKFKVLFYRNTVSAQLRSRLEIVIELVFFAHRNGEQCSSLHYPGSDFTLRILKFF
jgi:hypothetical protein